MFSAGPQQGGLRGRGTLQASRSRQTGSPGRARSGSEQKTRAAIHWGGPVSKARADIGPSLALVAAGCMPENTSVGHTSISW